jgi:hypothetical protein
MTIRSCPHCAKPIEVDFRVWEYDDEPDIELHRAPLRDWPCVPLPWPNYYPPLGGNDDRTYMPACSPTTRGYDVCNWLGPTCNDPSHVTPCYAAWYRRQPTCSLVADVVRNRAAVGLARCVQGKQA